MRILSISVIFSMMLITSQNLLIYIDFKWNQDDIVRSLCINRDKPVLSCNGKCQLNKYLQEAEQERNDQKTTNSQVKLELIDHEFVLPAIGYIEKIVVKTMLWNIQHYPIKSIISKVFHPPRIA